MAAADPVLEQELAPRFAYGELDKTAYRNGANASELLNALRAEVR